MILHQATRQAERLPYNPERRFKGSGDGMHPARAGQVVAMNRARGRRNGAAGAAPSIRGGQSAPAPDGERRPAPRVAVHLRQDDAVEAELARARRDLDHARAAMIRTLNA